MAQTPAYTTDTAISKDGTKIGYRIFGSQGPAVILAHGGMKSSQDFNKLAQILSDEFTIYVPDRRGRGLSDPVAEPYSVDREAEDIQAIITKTGAQSLFGLSAGARVMLRTARLTPSIKHLGLYEPPFSIHGSTPTAWVPRYEDYVARGKLASALTTGMQGLGVLPIMQKIPRAILVPAFGLVMLLQGKGTPEDVAIRSLVYTWHFDMKLIAEMADRLDDYEDVQAQTLLMGGSTSPAWLRVSLDGLEKTLPHVQRLTIPGQGHSGAEDDGDPATVAVHLRKLFKS